ncbi:hypothetical protein KM043_006730 [Ampulex compressa]|nr:hypothetical protein KM043_006730 [Ampulex compressa]
MSTEGASTCGRWYKELVYSGLSRLDEPSFKKDLIVATNCAMRGSQGVQVEATPVINEAMKRGYALIVRGSKIIGENQATHADHSNDLDSVLLASVRPSSDAPEQAENGSKLGEFSRDRLKFVRRYLRCANRPRRVADADSSSRVNEIPLPRLTKERACSLRKVVSCPPISTNWLAGNKKKKKKKKYRQLLQPATIEAALLFVEPRSLPLLDTVAQNRTVVRARRSRLEPDSVEMIGHVTITTELPTSQTLVRPSCTRLLFPGYCPFAAFKANPEENCFKNPQKEEPCFLSHDATHTLSSLMFETRAAWGNPMSALWLLSGRGRPLLVHEEQKGEEGGERKAAEAKKDGCVLYSPKPFPDSLSRATLVALLTVNGLLGRWQDKDIEIRCQNALRLSARIMKSEGSFHARTLREYFRDREREREGVEVSL